MKIRPTLVCLVVLMAAIQQNACVRLPDADAAAQAPQIDELVERVKCDIYDAFEAPLTAPEGYEWLHTWTAQANLNVIVSDQSQLTPGVVLTEPLSAKTVPGVVTSFSRSFNMGLGGQLSNTATRNESLTFTVSLAELLNEYKNKRHNCAFPEGINLESELGIRDWVASSLSPVAERRLLDIGYHKAPKTGTSAAASSATKAIQATGAAMRERRFTATIGTLRDAHIKVQPPECKRPPGHDADLPSRADILLDLTVVACDLFTFQAGPPQAPDPAAPPAPGGQPPAPIPTPPVHDLGNLDGNTIVFVAKTIRDIQIAIRDLTVLGDVANGPITALENTAIALAVFVDPPLDTLSHQVQFIVALNGTASPSWTLLRFKGPGPSSGSLASLTKTKTHTLNLVIGPPGSPDSAGALNALQTGTALTNALNSGAVSIVSH